MGTGGRLYEAQKGIQKTAARSNWHKVETKNAAKNTNEREYL